MSHVVMAEMVGSIWELVAGAGAPWDLVTRS
jgi:hypothetical protein